MLDEIKYLVIDVDGTMTDGGIYYDEHGNESKKFCTKDAAGFFAAKQCGIQIIVLTGRECAATSRRMKEMQVDFLFQNIKDKVSFLKKFMEEHKISRNEIGYIGDDLNDLAPMQLTGFVGCPSDSCEEVIQLANYISKKKGGYGVVRDVVETLLKDTDRWDKAVMEVYGCGI